jgi:plasmid stabilization system protein ParE
MTRRLIVRPLAQADIDDAVTWYEQQQSGLGSRFLDVLDHVFERIRDTPLQFPIIAVAMRRALLHVSIRRVLSGDRTSGRDPSGLAFAPRPSELATSRVMLRRATR